MRTAEAIRTKNT